MKMIFSVAHVARDCAPQAKTSPSFWLATHLSLDCVPLSAALLACLAWLMQAFFFLPLLQRLRIVAMEISSPSWLS
jgi:hypothetical protein